MNKSPQYNQQSKSEVEQICIYQNMERGRRSILYMVVGSMSERIPRNNI